MSNVKEVDVEGKVPFTIGEDEEVNKFLGWLNSPSNGIRIHWSDNAVEYRKNEHGGETAYYEFKIVGMEGYRLEFFLELVRVFRKAGAEFITFWVRDVQNRGTWFSLLAHYEELGGK